jgi:hypothetical protein
MHILIVGMAWYVHTNDKIRTYLESISVILFAHVCYIVGEFQVIGSCFL